MHLFNHIWRDDVTTVLNWDYVSSFLVTAKIRVFSGYFLQGNPGAADCHNICVYVCMFARLSE